MPRAISILGAGSWGTALAIQAARNGCDTLLWSHNSQHLESLVQLRENKRYLPNALFPESLKLSGDLQEVASSSQIILIAVPSHAFRKTLELIKPLLSSSSGIAWATKGFDDSSSALLSDTAKQVLGDTRALAVLSGPTFAREVADDLPTALTIASTSDALSGQLIDILHNQRFRIYTSTDLVGVQIGGATKNVLAIAAGIADGLGFGANTRAALITRGLTEIMRLGIKLGGQPDTFMGLAGLGDLILTCTDNQSRNRRFGLALGQGKDQTQALNNINQEVEGISAAREAYQLSKRLGVEMPITEQVYKVLFEQLPPVQAVQNLLARDLKSEHS